MAQTIETSSLATFDIKRFIFRVLANWYWFVITVSVAYAYVTLKNLYQIPIYGVHTKIMIQKKQTGEESYLKSLQFFDQGKSMEDEIEMLKSYQLNYQTISELPEFRISYFKVERFSQEELYKNTPIVFIPDTALYNAAHTQFMVTALSENEVLIEIKGGKFNQKVLLGESIQSEVLNGALIKTSKFSSTDIGKQYMFTISELHSLTNYYASNIKIQLITETGGVLWLWTSGTVAEKEADYLNKLVELYIENELEQKNKIAENTIQFIDKQLVGIIDSLKTTGDSLQEFQLSTGIFNLSQEGDALYDGIKNAQETIVELYFKKKYYHYVLNQVKSKTDTVKSIIIPSVMGIDDVLLMQKIETVSRLNEQLKEKGFGVLDVSNVPSVRIIAEKIELFNNQIIRYVEGNLAVLDQAVNEKNNEIKELSLKIQRLPAIERKMTTIERKYNFNDNIYTYLLQKKTEAGITKASNKTDVKVLDKAKPENRILQTQNQANPMSAMLLGLIIPIVIIVLKDFFNFKIIDRSDIERSVHSPIIGTIGHYEKKSGIPVFENPKSPISESYRVLRTNLQYLLLDDLNKVIGLTSTSGGEGKTFTSVNLASIIAMSNKKTLLIGLDLRKPKIHIMFDMPNDIGISNYLIGQYDVDQIILPTQIANLSIVLSGPIPPNPAELIESEKMFRLIEYAKMNFDYIIIDTPPVAIVTDALLISQYTDINLYVIRQNYTLKSAANIINEVAQKMNRLNIVINDVEFDKGYGYDYSYSYGFGMEHGYYEDEGTKPGLLARLKGFFR